MPRRKRPWLGFNMDDIEIGPAFWERVDHALRVTMAAAFSGTILFFSGQNVMAIGFFAVVVVVAFEPRKETVGACLMTIPLVWRGTVIGALLGLLGVVAVLQPLMRLSDGDDTAYLAAFPFVSAAAAFLIALFKWIPQFLDGITLVMVILIFANAQTLIFTWQILLAMLFGSSTTLVFKLLPLPTSSSLPALLSSSSQTRSNSLNLSDDSYQQQKRPFIVRSSFALPKVRILIDDGRRLAAAIISMLVDVAIAEAYTSGKERLDDFSEHDDEDDDIVARRHALAAIKATIKKLEQHIIPEIAARLPAAQVEIKLLWIANREEAQQLTEWLGLLRTLVPTLRFLERIVEVNHYEDEIREGMEDGPKEDPLRLQENFKRYMEIPLRALARALEEAMLNNAKDSSTLVLQSVNRANQQLMTAVADHRFDLFYCVKPTESSPLPSSKVENARWSFFARGMSFAFGMNRLAKSILVGTFEAVSTPNETFIRVQNNTKKDDGSRDKPLPCLCSRNWLHDISAVVFSGIDWKDPFECTRDDLLFAWNFSVQIGLAALWYAIPFLNERMNNQGLFVSVTTSIIAMMGKFGRSFQKSVQRLLGTAIASIWAMFVVATLNLSTTQVLNATYPYILVCLMLSDRKNPYTMDCAAFTAVILLFHRTPFPTHDELFSAVTFRIATVGIGIIQFIIVDMAFFRDSARTRVEGQSRYYFCLLDCAFDGFAQFASNLSTNGEDEGKKKILKSVAASLALCKASTADTLDDLSVAQQEPGPKIDVKAHFAFEEYSELLSVQASMNTNLSQILDCFHAMVETPEKDVNKVVYQQSVRYLQGIIDSVRNPLNRLTSDERDVKNQQWQKGLRRFKKSSIKQIAFDFSRQMRSYNMSVEATDKGVMVEQAFMLQWFAVSRCLLEVCDAFHQASICYENIASKHPDYCAIQSLPLVSKKVTRAEVDIEHPQPAKEEKES